MDTKAIIDKAGGPAAVAKLFDIRSQAVSQWDVIPPNRVLTLEAATGISRHEMRPDIYGPDPAAVHDQHPVLEQRAG